jgi:putative colanic acid biosynthesis acetyltransferase WcaF
MQRLNQKLYLAAWRLFGAPIFRIIPTPLFILRVLVLRSFAGDVALTASVYPSARIYSPRNLSMAPYSCISYGVDVYNVARVAIGFDSVVSQYSTLCTASHDFKAVGRPLRANPIVIGNSSWVCSHVFISPGVIIGNNCIVAARSTIYEDVDDNLAVSSTQSHFPIGSTK